MKEFMLFTREKVEDGDNVFQGDFEEAAAALEAAACFRDDDFYRIISFESNKVIAEGPVSRLFNLIIGRDPSTPRPYRHGRALRMTGMGGEYGEGSCKTEGHVCG